MGRLPRNVRYWLRAVVQSCKYQEKYADLSRRPTRGEIKQSYRIAQELGINFEALTFEKSVWGLRT